MFGLKAKLAIVFSLCIFVSAVYSCEDEKKEVCCQCKCFSSNNPSGQTQYKDTEIGGVNLNCDKECRIQCEDVMGWELDQQTKKDGLCESTPQQ